MFKSTFVLLALGAVIANAAAPKTERAVLRAPSERKPAPAFRLIDASGKAVRLSDYRGKPVLLDFWATSCGGVAGVSMDILYEDLKGPAEAWSKVRPFIQEHKVNYPILMGDDQVTKSYAIEALPATYLLDKHGRVAATYVGVVDKEDVERNVKGLLSER